MVRISHLKNENEEKVKIGKEGENENVVKDG